MSEKLCLKWNDFQENLNSAFGSLREDNAFTDVTLACVDGEQLETHKVILATSSPFFQNLLGRNKHAHPMVYLKGVKSDDLVAILDFLYYGETNVFQDHLEPFLEIAEEFQLKGLTGKIVKEGAKEEKEVKPTIQNPNPSKQKGSNGGGLPSEKIANDILEQSGNVLAIPNNTSGDFKELDEKVNSMIEKNETLTPTRHMCKVCGKECSHRSDIKKHIEAKHLEGLSIPCNFCEKTFRSRRTVYEHELKFHK